MGPAMARSSGVQSWADVGPTKSEKGVQRVIRKQKTRLDLELSDINVAGITIPWISPKTWLEFFIRMGLWYRLAGLDFERKADAGTVWEHFWNRYEELHPHHQIFDAPFDRRRTAAIYIHGDEGRTLKKGGVLITSIQSCLGAGFDKKRLKRTIDGSYKLQVNYQGHTFTNRYVCSILPKTCYEKKAQVMHDMMETLGKSLADIFSNGVDGGDGYKYRLCAIATKGDWPYLVKVGNLMRNFSTTVKRGNQKHSPKGICHLCLAGTVRYPYEEIGELHPSWEATMGVREPWSQFPKYLRRLPLDNVHPAMHFQGDPWHTIHLGIGRGFVTSTTCLALQFVPMRLVEEKWQWLTDHFLQFCRDGKYQPHISKITPGLMGYSDAGGPNGMWHKGALTTTLLKWLEKLLPDLQIPPGHALEKALQGARHLNTLFSFMFNSGYFLDRDEGLFCSHLGRSWLVIYRELAELTYAQGWAMYPLLPKAHAFEHMILRMARECEIHNFTQNPLVVGCQADEDLVGRVSRLTRRVHIRAVIHNTFQRYLTQAYSVWVGVGMIKHG